MQVTAESSDSQTVTPPSTPTPSMTAVLQTPSSMRLHTWPSPLDDDDDGDDGDLGNGNRSAASRIPSPFGNTVLTSITSTIVPPARTTTTINGKPTTTTTTTTTTTSSDTTSAQKNTKPSVTFAKIRKPLHQLRVKFRNLDPVKLAYLRTSFIFAVSIIVTWTPSSINRVYSFVHPRSTSYVLNLASAVVLPLQGVWNASIFCFSSWSIIKEEVREWKKKHGISGGWGRSNSRRCGERLAGGDGNFIGGHRNGFVPMRYGNGFGGYRYGNGLDDAELIEATSPRRMSTMRVIRGGSL